MRAGPFLALLLAAAFTSGCQLGAAGPEATVERLAKALAAGDLTGLDLDDADAGSQYAAILEPLDGELAATVEATDVTTDGDTAQARLDWSWDVAGTAWDYTTEGRLVRVEDEWQVDWDPALVEPTLQTGDTLDTVSLTPGRGDILGAGDVAVVTRRDVVRLGLDKTKVDADQVAGSARRIARLLDVDRKDFVATAKEMGDKAFVEAVVLRAEDAREDVPPAYADVPGAVTLPDQLPLAPTRGFAAPILGSVGQATAEMVEESEGAVVAGDEVGLSGLQARYDERLRGTAGLRVVAVDEEGESRTLHETPAVDGEPLRTTFEPDLQVRAEAALADVKPASAVVVIRPATGAIAAAASGPGSGGLNTATYGQYAPGSTFKVVSSLALLRSGLSPSSPLGCPATTVVDGKRFKNYDDYLASGLGRITLRQAMANSCNTAFITSRGRLGDSDLAEAAAALGVGVDHDLGFPAYFGQVPAPEGETEAAADLIGQGRVLASPMAMVAVAASVTAGRAVLPVLLPDHEVTETEPGQPLTRGEARALRGLMRAVVTDGSGRFLSGLGTVGAKTGTAEHGTPGPGGSLPTHAWMIATRGDLAVAVFVETGESGSGTAGPILQAVLS